ncbi:hypothetical protein M2136_000357 [Parabacteroides sp. PH5-33]|nr:hypothetical protein [Parabacteroides sp. PH5-33]
MIYYFIAILPHLFDRDRENYVLLKIIQHKVSVFFMRNQNKLQNIISIYKI